MTSFKTEQEAFWAGEFGDEYISRNNDSKLLASKVGWFAKVLSCIPGGDVHTCLEFGSNVGLNLRALHLLLPELESAAVEINAKAAEECGKISHNRVFCESILNFTTEEQFDLTFTAGVLIHIAPEELPKVYESLYQHSRRYILISEYYNPTPTEVAYRGHAGRLFKRDFAGELMDCFPDVELLDYGFGYYRDKQFPMGDHTWFLMAKKKWKR